MLGVNAGLTLLRPHLRVFQEFDVEPTRTVREEFRSVYKEQLKVGRTGRSGAGGGVRWLYGGCLSMCFRLDTALVVNLSSWLAWQWGSDGHNVL
jgi:hypothetical protein